MQPDLRWVILDTETDGFRDPIHVIEIAAQIMVGWQPAGVPFRILINHGIDIDYQAKEVHGYDRYFLEQNGVPPLEAYAALRDYVKESPIVTHNLSYDWDRALTPEWDRLGIPHIGSRGFCSVMLAKRVLPELDGHNLDKLKAHFGLSGGRSHRALGDVTTLVRLMSNIIAPRLGRASLDTFEMIQRFSTKDIKACHRVISAVQAREVKPAAPPINKPITTSSEATQSEEADAPAKPVPTVYHIARPGKIIGQFHSEGLFRALREGLITYDDVYWTAGMGQEWRKLSEIKLLIEQAAPKMASERQVVYLRWLGIQNAHLLTADEAARLIQTRGGNLGYSPDGKCWSTEKLILHPDLFGEELIRHLSGKVLRDCVDGFHEEYFESSRLVDWDTAFKVINSLQAEDRHWWNREDFREVFLLRLKVLFPECCDGKSVFYYRKLPAVLTKYVRSKVYNSSQQLTKDKVESVMEHLRRSDLEWHKKDSFKELFFMTLDLMYPACCDGQPAEERRAEVRKNKSEVIAQARDEIKSQLGMAGGGDPVAQYKVALCMRTIGCLTSDYSLLAESYDWLRKSAMGDNSEAQLEIAFFLSNKNGLFRPPFEEVIAWLRICYFSGKYPSAFEEVNGKKKYVINPISQKILREIEDYEHWLDEDGRAKSDALFKELCTHLRITPTR
jgi:DNA polymerase III epsilon subunit-like protein